VNRLSVAARLPQGQTGGPITSTRTPRPQNYSTSAWCVQIALEPTAKSLGMRRIFVGGKDRK
jgi:hypothetical protein